LRRKGSFSNGEKCGEWIEFGETKTYPPCPPSETTRSFTPRTRNQRIVKFFFDFFYSN